MVYTFPELTSVADAMEQEQTHWVCQHCTLPTLLENPEKSPNQPALERALFNDLHIDTAIQDLLRSRTQGNRRTVYLDSLEMYLRRFAKEHSKPVTAITTTEIEAWLDQFDNPNSRATWLSRISTLFSFCERKGHILKNPCHSIDRITIDRPAPVILTVAQAEEMVKTCPGTTRPYLILALYAGIRPDEIRRLDWKDICLETKTVKVFGKTRRRRLVPLHPKAVALLKACCLKCGPVAPSHSTIRRWLRSVRPLLGGKWTADILRHTAASFLMALHSDAGKVAAMLGNSPQILATHYLEPVPQVDCDAFWKV
ncbi:MAG: tyrosine-type recombinase/integrase [Verrucomicrobiota bacterium]